MYESTELIEFRNGHDHHTAQIDYLWLSHSHETRWPRRKDWL